MTTTAPRHVLVTATTGRPATGLGGFARAATRAGAPSGVR